MEFVEMLREVPLLPGDSLETMKRSRAALRSSTALVRQSKVDLLRSLFFMCRFMPASRRSMAVVCVFRSALLRFAEAASRNFFQKFFISPTAL